jgi:hypothetical protein
MAARSLASPSSPGATPPASELNFDNISASTNFSGCRTPSDSRERTARRRSSARVEGSSSVNDRGSAGFATKARSFFRAGASRRAEMDPSFTTNEPGVCSRHSVTTPRRRSAGRRATIAARTAETPPGLWLPLPVISRTSLDRLTCRSRNHASARWRASAALGSDSRRFRMFFVPNSASSKAFQTECRETLPDRILKYMTLLLALRGRARGKSERRRDGDSPAFGSFHKDPLGNAARSRVLLRHGIAVGTVHDPRSNWQHAQIPRDESVWPGRIATCTPALIPELQAGWPVTSQRARVEIRGEIPRAVAFVNRVYVLFEYPSCVDRV